MKMYKIGGRQVTETELRRLAAKKKTAIGERARARNINTDSCDIDTITEFMTEAFSDIAGDLIVSSVQEVYQSSYNSTPAYEPSAPSSYESYSDPSPSYESTPSYSDSSSSFGGGDY
jgi:hypothetical protein